MCISGTPFANTTGMPHSYQQHVQQMLLFVFAFYDALQDLVISGRERRPFIMEQFLIARSGMRTRNVK